MKQLLFVFWMLILPLSAHADITWVLAIYYPSFPTLLVGIPCKKEALLYPDGHLEGCLLARDADVNGHVFPEDSWPYFDPPGVLKCVFLAHDYKVQGYPLRGEGHNYQTCFHPNGWLAFGNLSEPTEIQGVPCGISTFWKWILKGPSGISFHDNGRLKGCRLSKDVNQFRKDQWIEIDRPFLIRLPRYTD